MKSSDEIKKGLEEEIPVHYHIDGEPRLTPRLLMDMQWLHKDALALIQQLQYDNAQLNRCIENMTDKLNAMNEEAAKLQAERDAAMDALKSNCTCPECKYFSDDIQEPCRGCKPNDSKFEWRGVQKEE